MKVLTTRVLLLSAALLTPLACKDSGAPEGTAPAIPPEATFAADFSNFQSSSGVAGFALSNAATTAGTNWAYSAIGVGFWNTVLFVTLAPPVAAFHAALTQTAVGENGAWIWRYNFTVLGAQYSARLEARPATNSVDWSMYISKAGEFTDFLWYTGNSKLDGTSGTWSLKNRPAEPSKFIDIAWNRNASAGTGDIKYTNVVTGSADNGSYILHALTTGTYDANVELGNAATSNVTRIEWNRTNHSGRVRDQAHFGDANWHCWDTSLNNLAC
jgi:hypothetical protein